jgi:hypothetical protein
MTRTNTDDAENEIFPRDQLEYYKLEVTRLRTENERLSSEVDFLRQALAATLSKIPQLEGATGSANAASTTPLTPPQAPAGSSRWLWQHGATVPSYVRYFSMASLMASPVLLLIILILGLICTILFFASVWFLPNGLI